MSDTDERAILLKRVDDSIETFKRSYKKWQYAQWFFTIIIAAAGFLTAYGSATPVDGSEPPLYGTPNALFLWGIIGVIAAALNQAMDPARRSEKTHQNKLALHQIQIALQFNKRIDVPTASRLYGMALKNPDQAIAELLSYSTNPQPNPQNGG